MRPPSRNRWSRLALGFTAASLSFLLLLGLAQLNLPFGIVEPTAIGLLAGSVCGWIIGYFNPSANWLLVFAHEATHVVVAWMFGGRVKSFKITPSHGNVVLTRTNTWIELAPYILPLYATIILLSLFILQRCDVIQRPNFAISFALGLAYVGHLLAFGHSVLQSQKDFSRNGTLCSLWIILAGHLLWLTVAAPIVFPENSWRSLPHRLRLGLSSIDFLR